MSNPTHQAEVSMLGAVLLSNRALGRCADIVAIESFADPRHRLVWASMLRLDGRGDPIDAVTLASSLEADGSIGQAGGLAYLIELTSASATAVNVEAHARLVADGSKRRRLLEAAQGIARQASDTSQTIGEALSAADGLLAALLDTPGRGEVIQTQRESIAELSQLLQNTSQHIYPRKIPWGFNLELLNRETTGGADPDCELTVVAGRSGHGKTHFMDQLADEIGRAGLGVVLYFTVEVTGGKLEQRRTARKTGISINRIKDWHGLNAGEQDRVIHVMNTGQAQDDGVVTLSKGAMDIGFIGRKIRQWCRRGPVAAVFVDYYQRLALSDGRRYGDAREKLDALAAALKIIQVENKVALYVGAQLNRGDPRNPQKLPSGLEIRGSDALYHEASVVLVIHRPARHDFSLTHSDGRTEDAVLIVDKNREGPVFILPVLHQPDCGRFWMQHDGWMHSASDVERMRERRRK